jgi:hypothetical protein
LVPRLSRLGYYTNQRASTDALEVEALGRREETPPTLLDEEHLVEWKTPPAFND